MKAFVLSGVHQLSLAEVAVPQPIEGEVTVSIHAAALNHRDIWIKAGQYSGLKYPCIPGSDGAGIVSAVGRGVDPSWKGREVIINPSLDWGDSPHAQGPEFSILGLPREGTLAEEVVVPVDQLVARPAHLSWEEAAALPLAGLTAYRALFTRAELKPEDRVLITGVGGGVAQFALQFAVAYGAKVFVTSSSPEKLLKASHLGASGGFNYTDPAWMKAAGSFDVIVDSAGGETFDKLVDLAAPGGRIVFYGATRGNAPSLALRKIFWRQISLLGTTMGSPDDWTEMVAFVERHQLRPAISDRFPFVRAVDAFALMERGGQFGKIVVSVR